MINLMKGDCLEVMKGIPSGSIDMILTDPPYGTTACKWDSIIPLEPMWEQLKRIVKPNGAIVMTASQPFTSVLICSNLKMFKYDWAWQKPKGTGHLNAKKQPMRDKEDILVFYAKQCTYNPQMAVGAPYKDKAGKDHGATTSMTDSYGAYTNKREDNTGFRYPKQVLQFGVVERGTVHPTQKPVDLMEYLIKTYTNEGDTVLDFACGSGTTGVAAKNLNRDFIGIELDDKYFEIAKERINGK
ncbi:DNA methylase [Vibrio phage 1.135.O._10N.222.54.B6]|nr:DNA methylase [Vibrio phage jenny 12G5]AUR89944.1 DNA methylase [Vibrio phage 1.135.O._10N.222.54.B6]